MTVPQGPGAGYRDQSRRDRRGLMITPAVIGSGPKSKSTGNNTCPAEWQFRLRISGSRIVATRKHIPENRGITVVGEFSAIEDVANGPRGFGENAPDMFHYRESF